MTSSASTHKDDDIVLVLQGGGALGAYQAGVYDELSRTYYTPNWVAGVSIGSINAALIAGNPPEHRVARLREFWYRVSSHLLWPKPAQDRKRPAVPSPTPQKPHAHYRFP